MTEKQKEQHRYWGSVEPPKAKTEFFSAVATPVSEGSDAKVATIRMYGPIDSWGGWWGISTEDVGRVLDALPDTVEQIVLRINSPGGEVWEAVAILNMLSAHKANVVAVVDGLAASAASFIAAGCDETVMSPGSQMMIHSPHMIAWGNAVKLRKHAAFLDKLEESCIEIYTAKAGEQDWRSLLAEETWLSAADAVALGLADRAGVVPDAGTATTVGADDEETDDLIVITLDDDADAAAAARIHAAAASARAAAPKPPDSTEPGNPANKEELTMSDKFLADVRDRLGITDANASEETVLAALDERVATPAPTAALPDGVVPIEATQLEQMRADAAAGRQARDEQIATARAATVEAAVADGRIAPARRDHWIAALAADEGAAATLAGLEKGLIPLEPKGHTGGIDQSSDEDGTYSKLFPTAKAEEA
ncbi:head maturation protease, ClpP-related [Microbacterium sp. SORGH_AS_0862]|uniref:head maturation protease, ClpP-related n=1 Tax=Microbacterium sp. SORGH_AS_0862 TaxID=3041789 RepID=UPI0027921907|nr:head maturation protease, ClpP-related [Microbacterium sp. SORGH_AS_0862]MDQ1206198.1 ATP-dependent protease ClpP protease subunit [Microbacterium sp. SORGH_AS_0862]